MEAAGGPPPDLRNVLHGLSRLWWLWLVFGVAWTIVAVVILQFDDASVTTVGIIIGLMFFATGLQQLAIAVLVDRGGWLFGIFGFLFIVCGVIAFISPENTFAAIADILGFLFLIVGILLIVGFFMETVSAIIIFTPLFLPVAKSAGIDPLHLGVIMVMTLMVGVITPPVGIVLFIMQRVSGLPIEKVFRSVLPFFVPLLIMIVLLVLFPIMSTWLPTAYLLR